MRLLTPEQRAVADRIRRSGKDLQTVKAPPVCFRALLSVNPPLDPETELGSDTREKCMMELIAPGPAIAMNDQLTQLDSQSSWVVLWMDNNPADFTVKYIIAKVVEGLDT